MTVPAVVGVELGGHQDLPLLVVGPSLGTSVHALWEGAVGALIDRFHIVGWDLPGHGRADAASGPFTIGDLAEGVLVLADRVLAERGEPRGRFAYAGVSASGAVGLRLLIDHPGRISSATLLCTGATIATPQSWAERAAAVRAGGIAAVVEGSAQRWFAPGFIERQPEVATALLSDLRDTDGPSYAWTCEALADFDARHQLDAITAPVLAIAGAADPVTPEESLRAIAESVQRGRFVVLENVAHLAPAEAPAEVAGLLAAQVASARTVGEVYDDGMAVRRAVLGESHVDRATASATDLTQDFQELITQYAWGTIWSRPGLDRRSRSMVTLTALVAGGHFAELELHLRAARTNGLTDDEIKEVLLQTAVYCGVPAANTAFRIAQDVLFSAAGDA